MKPQNPKVLVIGQGGREHAFLKVLAKSPRRPELHVAPGSEGMSCDAICHSVNMLDPAQVTALALREKFDLVIVGPEAPLANGVTDALRGAGFLVFGPDQMAAQLEASKVFSKEFMFEYRIPTATSQIVRSVPEVAVAAKHFTPPFVLKADGLAAGKGVTINANESELKESAHALFVDKIFGAAGEKALLEQFQPGYELSYFILTNGREYEPLPLAQDHKRLKDGDQGPNTGGMGTVAPMPIDLELDHRIRTEVADRVMHGFKARGFNYRGVLFIGLMITADGPKVIEFNVRFGDPETQVLLPLLDGDWLTAFELVAKGEMPRLKWLKKSTACLVLAADGYPDTPKKGITIDGLTSEGKLSSPVAGVEVLHAGTKREKDGSWVTHGGRVLNIVSEAESTATALAQAYSAAQKISSAGLQYRLDIGKHLTQKL